MPQSADLPSIVLKRKALHSGQRNGVCQKTESMAIVVKRAKRAEVMPAGRRVVRRRLLKRFGGVWNRRKRQFVNRIRAISDRKIIPATVSRERAMR